MTITATIEAATPGERDRFLDFLRVAAIVMVVLGHWLVRVVTESDGELAGGYLLELAPGTRWATLVWQVMPLYFLAGGVVNAQSWRRARSSGEAPTAWVRRRARRLLYPLLPFLIIAIPTIAWLHTGARYSPIIDPAVVLFPLWFLAVYLVVTALTPLSLALHERGASWVMVVGVALIIALDILRFGVGGPRVGTQPAVAGPNFLLVWALIHQIGYLWADGRLPGTTAGRLALSLVGASALAVMIASGLYPLAMVPIEGTTEPNNGAPPSAALIALSLVQLGLCLLMRERIVRWLHYPKIWVPVALIGVHVVTIYLWHQPAMVVVANLAYSLGWIPATADIDALWWTLRPVWILACLVLLIPISVVMRWLGTPATLREPHAIEAGNTATIVGLALSALGIAGLIAARPGPDTFALPLFVLFAVTVLAGLMLLGVVNRRALMRSRPKKD